MRPGSPPHRTPWSGAELALAAALPATVFAFTMGSSSVAQAVETGRLLRWVLLFLLAGVAVVFGWPNRRSIPPWFLGCVGALAALGLVSALWSVTPRITAERAVSFLVLTLVAVFVGAGALRSLRRLELVLVALLAAPVLVAVAGLLLYGVDRELAAQPGGPFALRGFGENPNTASMLFAVALPLAAWQLVEAEKLCFKAAAAAVAALLYGSVLASDSRGAMLASAAGVVVFAAVRVQRLRVRVPVVLVLIAAFAASFELAGSRSFVAAEPSEGQTAAASGSRFTIHLLPPGVASASTLPFVPEHNEIGFPGVYEYKPILAYGSGRVYAWLSAVRQGLERPVLGHGFGTEQRAFAERFYNFDGGYTENSLVGMFLQFGLVGVLLLLAPFVLVAVAVIRALRRLHGRRRALIAVGAGTMAAGLVVGGFQSYLYSVGNVATLTFWIAAFVVATAVSTFGRAA